MICFGRMVVLWLSLIFWSQGQGASPIRITALLGQDGEPYRQVLAGIEETLRKQYPDIDIAVARMDETEPELLVQEVRKTAPRVLVPLGQKAADFALYHFQRLPICAALVLNGAGLRAADNATGLLLSFPLAVQIQWLKTLLAPEQALALLYGPEQREKALAFQTQAGALGMRVVLRPVPDIGELLPVLESLPRETALLYSFADSGIFTPKTAKTVLLFSFRSRIPVAGLSREWVRAGALFALDRDYFDIGRQCADSVLAILDGQKPSALPLKPPRTVRLSLNLKTARHMKLTLPASLLSHAEQFE